MSRAMWLAVVLLTSAPLAGCLGSGSPDETIDPTATGDEHVGDDAPRGSGGGDEPGPGPDPGATDPDAGGAGEGNGAPSGPVFTPPPTVTVAHVDTGINPYHAIFRDDTALGAMHPSEYIPGYPADAQALDLSLHAASYDAAVEADADLWAATEPNTLYWVPGTRIIGLYRPCSGDCADVHLEPDPQGHGTMTASRSVGPDSLAPSARFVSVQGTGAGGVRWAADQGWIDVQTNSWLSFVPPQASSATPADVDDTTDAFAYAAERMVTLAASGNGAAYITGFAPTPTYVLSTAAPGVILVGAHDNGRVTLWHGQPTHVVADGYGGPRAEVDTIAGYGADGDACCTSAASPYAAGGAAAIVLEARRALGDVTPGVDAGVLAEAASGVAPPPTGPLSDGELTVDEVRDLLFATATPRPIEGPHDGVLHWAATGSAPADPQQPGGNPYCHGCWTTPLAWADVPADVPAYPNVGYGSIDPPAIQRAVAVLLGLMDAPQRTEVDEFYAADQQVREEAVQVTADALARLAGTPPA